MYHSYQLSDMDHILWHIKLVPQKIWSLLVPQNQDGNSHNGKRGIKEYLVLLRIQPNIG